MIIRHSKKALFIDVAIGIAIFIVIYFAFERFLTNDLGIYIIGFFITLLACFGPFIKDYYKYKFNYLEIDKGNIITYGLFSKVVIPVNKFADYRISSGIYEKLLKIYDLEIYTIGGETYMFNRIDKEINFEELMDTLTAPKE